MLNQNLWRGGGAWRGGFSPPTFLKIIKCHYSQLPHFQSSSTISVNYTHNGKNNCLFEKSGNHKCSCYGNEKICMIDKLKYLKNSSRKSRESFQYQLLNCLQVRLEYVFRRDVPRTVVPPPLPSKHLILLSNTVLTPYKNLLIRFFQVSQNRFLYKWCLTGKL